MKKCSLFCKSLKTKTLDRDVAENAVVCRFIKHIRAAKRIDSYAFAKAAHYGWKTALFAVVCRFIKHIRAAKRIDPYAFAKAAHYGWKTALFAAVCRFIKHIHVAPKR